MSKATEEGKKIEVKGAEVTHKVLDGEEEDAFLKQCIVDMKERKKNMKHKGHKRRGGFGGGGGPGGKRRRN